MTVSTGICVKKPSVPKIIGALDTTGSAATEPFGGSATAKKACPILGRYVLLTQIGRTTRQTK
jgi:hypothetical protein